ncbi:MAG: hypothetical protein R6W69_13520 [Anaerolineales bacterium]
MNPYSHLVLAHRLQDEIQPANLPDYYWGTVAADTRYTAHVARTRTHLPPEEILAFRARYPELESFIQGYLIHSLADEVELWALLERRWHLRPFIQLLPLKLTSVVMESYFVERNPLAVSISGNHNPMLAALGIPPAAAHDWRDLVNSVIAEPSFDSVLRLFAILGKDSPRLQKYLQAAKRANRIPIAKSILYKLTDPPRLLQSVEDFVRDKPEYNQIKS